MSWVIHCDLWAPLALARRLGVTPDGTPVPVPMFTWFCWHYANAATIAASRTCTDHPFPEGM